MSRLERLLHNMGLCPKEKMGYTCHGRENECGWPVHRVVAH